VNGPRFLPLLDQRIDERVWAIRSEHPFWPCQRGCSACCRSLGELPHATAAEWERLYTGFARLPRGTQASIASRIAALYGKPVSGPIACPFLDPGEGACLVYEHRLLACRAHGYFVSRGEGRWCQALESELAARAPTVMFGNLDAVLAEARGQGGDPWTLLAWWRLRA
jgi:Fe-S-cluster containining protein